MLGAAAFQVCKLKEQVRSITVACSVSKAESEPFSALHIGDQHPRQFCGAFNQGGTEARRRTNLHRIVLTLKSSGADSSVLTAGVPQTLTAMVVRTLGTACSCVGGAIVRKPASSLLPFTANIDVGLNAVRIIP